LYVFHRKDRITIQEKEKEEAKKRELEVEAKKMAEERRGHTLKVHFLTANFFSMYYYTVKVYH
jgi:uncharacterized protein YhaN